MSYFDPDREKVLGLTGKRNQYQIRSPRDDHYNCFGFAVNDLHHWWEPLDYKSARYTWCTVPTKEEPTIRNYIRCLNRLGFKRVFFPYISKPNPKEYRIVALYSKDKKFFEHISYQDKDGVWKSKCGGWEDIEHQESTTINEDYGIPIAIFKRLWIYDNIKPSDLLTRDFSSMWGRLKAQFIKDQN